MDLNNPDNPLFCPRATLYGAIYHVVKRAGRPFGEADCFALVILLGAFWAARGMDTLEDEHAQTFLDNVLRLAITCVVNNCPNVAGGGGYLWRAILGQRSAGPHVAGVLPLLHYLAARFPGTWPDALERQGTRGR